jgi:hypothetical protein
MASLNPLDLQNGRPIDVATLIEERDAAAFRSIIPHHAGLARSPANRILLPGVGSARKELLALPDERLIDILASHAISADAHAALLSGRPEEFLQHRKAEIERAVRDLAHRLAAWDRNDRPSLQYILRDAGEED